MTNDQLRRLQAGDIVCSKAGGDQYIVTANYGDRVTAVRTVDLTNAQEWAVVRGPVTAKGCRAKLADGQWWSFCGETDMGQSLPALCSECDPLNGLKRA